MRLLVDLSFNRILILYNFVHRSLQSLNRIAHLASLEILDYPLVVYWRRAVKQSTDRVNDSVTLLQNISKLIRLQTVTFDELDI